MKDEYDFSGAQPEGMTVITSWRVSEDALPDVTSGEHYERVITPQKHGTLCRIHVRGAGLLLVRLKIGAAAVPFALHDSDGMRRIYLPAPTQHASDCKSTSDAAHCGCAATVKLLAGQDVCLTLYNNGTAPAKPRAALLVREEDLS